MSILVPVDDLSAFHVGKVIEIVAWNRKPSGGGGVIAKSKITYAGRLEGFKQEGEKEIIISLKALGQFRFDSDYHKIMVRVREKSNG